jgi:hypothetical protein
VSIPLKYIFLNAVILTVNKCRLFISILVLSYQQVLTVQVTDYKKIIAARLRNLLRSKEFDMPGLHGTGYKQQQRNNENK